MDTKNRTTQKENTRGWKSTLSEYGRSQSIDGHSLKSLHDAPDEYDLSPNDDRCRISSDENLFRHRNRIYSRISDLNCWRARSSFAPSPKCNFGPKGVLKKIQNEEPIVVIQDPCSQRLYWNSLPNHVLIIKKPGPSTQKEFEILVAALLRRNLHVYVEYKDHRKISNYTDGTLRDNLIQCLPFDREKDLSKIDLIICLGGDGTLLHASSLFQKSCPPVLAFSMGSLGFLTPFDFTHHEDILNEVLSDNIPVLLRTRLNCTLIEDDSQEVSTPDTPTEHKKNDDEVNENGASSPTVNNETSHLALNEVVLDRGPNSYLSNLDLYVNGRFITKVQGDGLIISTPTGSTAYAMAAGASMVHPNVPAMVVCPICPHSLSFRPIVVPAGIELLVKVSEDARVTACVSLDGKYRHELHQNESIRITTSEYPLPVICQFDQLDDWFESLADILHWNIRKPQGSFSSQKKEEEKKERNGTENLDSIVESSAELDV